MLITHNNVKDTFLSKKSYEQILKRFHNLKTLLRINCNQTSIKLVLDYNNINEEINGVISFSTVSTHVITPGSLNTSGIYHIITFIIYKNNNFINIKNNNKKINYTYINIIIYIKKYIT